MSGLIDQHDPDDVISLQPHANAKEQLISRLVLGFDESDTLASLAFHYSHLVTGMLEWSERQQYVSYLRTRPRDPYLWNAE